MRRQPFQGSRELEVVRQKPCSERLVSDAHRMFRVSLSSLSSSVPKQLPVQPPPNPHPPPRGASEFGLLTGPATAADDAADAAAGARFRRGPHWPHPAVATQFDRATFRNLYMARTVEGAREPRSARTDPELITHDKRAGGPGARGPCEKIKLAVLAFLFEQLKATEQGPDARVRWGRRGKRTGS